MGVIADLCKYKNSSLALPEIRFFLENLSTVYMDKILAMIIYYLGSLENFIHRFFQNYHV